MSLSTNPIRLSVIVCTHNPRLDYLSETLAALKSQTLATDQWELVVVDNASTNQIKQLVDLSWHQHARILREETLGLTPARLRGIHETSAELIVFVDDDNVLESDYLQTALNISDDWPILGAWGGQIRGQFEKEPPEWARSFLGNLAIRELKEDRWSNLLHQVETTPFGAGMVIRRQVAETYRAAVSSDPDRIRLDRTGSGLSSCGDIDLAFTAVDVGLGMGLFTSLKVTHLIPANRLREDYLLKLQEKTSYSWAILDSFRGRIFSRPRRSLTTKIHDWGHLLRMDARSRRFELAGRRGLKAAEETLRNGSR